MKPIVILLIFTTVFSIFANKIESGKDGIFVQYLDGRQVKYIVDSKTQQCFFSITTTGGVTIIPCEGLAKREEWKPIITWIKKQNDE